MNGAAPPADAAAARRVLGFWSLLTLGINGIVGVGVFFAPAELAKVLPGGASALAFAVTALLLLPVAWTYGRLGSAYPEDGGPYVWAREALGERFAFGVGFVAYASAVLSTSTVVSALGVYLAPELGFESTAARFVFRVLATLLLAGITLLGLRLGAWVWSGLTLLKLLPLALLALFALDSLRRGAPTLRFSLAGGGLWRAALLAVFPLQGFEIVPVPAGEARGAKRSVLMATLLSLAFAAGLYVLLQLACVLALPKLAESSAPIVDAGSAITHDFGRSLFAGGANISAVGIAFGMFAMTPRYLSALGTESLLGRALSREHRGVPTLSLAITTASVIALVSSSAVLSLMVLSSLAVLLQYAVSAVALFRLAARGDQGLGLWDRALAPLSLLAIFVLARAAEATEFLTLGLLLAVGFGVLRARQALASSPRAR
ncbi:MAG TPA: APC family permease [Polyangiaceae bacterium]|nr:APC family permease [Polyangiaceae bacterium]